jgi:hypothetical protein
MAAWVALAAGCAGQSVATPQAAERAEVRTYSPMEVVEQFRASLLAGMVPAARFQLDEISHDTPAGDHYKQRLSRLAADMAAGGYDFRAVEQKVQQDCAAVLVRENPTRGGAPQYSAIWLIKRNTAWKISPEPWAYRRIAGLTAAQAGTFAALDQWVQVRRGELKGEPLK